MDDAMTQDPQARTVEDRMVSAAETFDLPLGAVRWYVEGKHYHLDHGPLHFGKRFRVMKGIASNLGDALVAGQDVRFVGAEHPSGTELVLYFESPKSDKIVLHFDQNAPQQPDRTRYLRDATAHFRPVLFDFAARRKRLVAAHAVLFHLRSQHEARL